MEALAKDTRERRRRAYEDRLTKAGYAPGEWEREVVQIRKEKRKDRRYPKERLYDEGIESLWPDEIRMLEEKRRDETGVLRAASPLAKAYRITQKGRKVAELLKHADELSQRTRKWHCGPAGSPLDDPAFKAELRSWGLEPAHVKPAEAAHIIAVNYGSPEKIPAGYIIHRYQDLSRQRPTESKLTSSYIFPDLSELTFPAPEKPPDQPTISEEHARFLENAQKLKKRRSA